MATFWTQHSSLRNGLFSSLKPEFAAPSVFHCQWLGVCVVCQACMHWARLGLILWGCIRERWGVKDPSPTKPPHNLLPWAEAKNNVWPSTFSTQRLGYSVPATMAVETPLRRVVVRWVRCQLILCSVGRLPEGVYPWASILYWVIAYLYSWYMNICCMLLALPLLVWSIQDYLVN